MPRGGARPNSGPKPGGKGKGRYPRTDAQRTHARAIVKKIITSANNPLDILIEFSVNPDVETHLRIQAAQAAAPYVHPKLSAAIVQTLSVGVTQDNAALIDRILGKLERIAPTIEHQPAEAA